MFVNSLSDGFILVCVETQGKYVTQNAITTSKIEKDKSPKVIWGEGNSCVRACQERQALLRENRGHVQEEHFEAGRDSWSVLRASSPRGIQVSKK